MKTLISEYSDSHRFLSNQNIMESSLLNLDTKINKRKRTNNQLLDQANFIDLQQHRKFSKQREQRGFTKFSKFTMLEDHHYDSTTTDYYDSSSSISLSDNDVMSERQHSTKTKTIEAMPVQLIEGASRKTVYLSSNHDALEKGLNGQKLQSPSQTTPTLSTTILKKQHLGSGTNPLSDTSEGSTSQSDQSLSPSSSHINLAETNSAEVQWGDLEPQNCPQDMSPDRYVRNIFSKFLGYKPKTKMTTELLGDFFPRINEEFFANYTLDVVTAVRENDLESLKTMHQNGQSLSCCNRYGESLLHMACRRGFHPIVSFLINEADVSLRMADDCGRNPLHDALWHKDTQYHIVDLLTRLEPALLLACDNRGYTPFSYCRQEHWPVWRQFLWDRKEHMAMALDKNKEMMQDLFK